MSKAKADKKFLPMFWMVMKYVKPYKWAFLFSVLLLGADVIYDVGYAWVQQWFIDAAGNHDVDRLLMLTSVCFAAGIGIICFFMMQFYLRNSVQSYMQRDMSIGVMRKIGTLPYSTLLRYHTGDLVSRVTRDVQQANGMIANIIYELMYNITLFIVAFGYLATINLRLALFIVVTAPIVFFIGKFFDARLRTLGYHQQQIDAGVRGFLQETLQGLVTVRIFHLEKLLGGKFKQKRDEQNRLHVQSSFQRTMMNQSVFATNQLITIACAFFTAYTAIQGTLTAGQVLAFLVLINRVQNPILSVIQTWGNFQQGLGAGERLQALFEERSEAGKTESGGPSAQDKAQHHADGVAGNQAIDRTGDREGTPATAQVGDAAQNGFNPAIQLSNIDVVVESAEEEGRFVSLLHSINLTVERNEFVALVGPSGAGKSTTARLCIGLIEPEAGEVEVLGMNIDKQVLPIRRRVSYVPQIPYLFTGTIRDNIMFGADEASEQEMTWAAQVCCADGFINQLDGGYDAMIGEQGEALSGGQRQRIALARAIIRRPDVLILDESTSAMDIQTEKAVIDALLEQLPGITILFVSHRLSALNQADRIVVMDQGKIVEQGTHAELISAEGVYFTLFRGQEEYVS
jgi:ATP-binding cassette subfamily B protein/subfamily B ATP-binding cassette protein MsbA